MIIQCGPVQLDDHFFLLGWNRFCSRLSPLSLCRLQVHILSYVSYIHMWHPFMIFICSCFHISLIYSYVLIRISHIQGLETWKSASGPGWSSQDHRLWLCKGPNKPSFNPKKLFSSQCLQVITDRTWTLCGTPEYLVSISKSFTLYIISCTSIISALSAVSST